MPAERAWPGAPVAAALAALSMLWIGLDAVWLAADEGIQTTDAAYHLSRIAALRGKLLGIETTGGFDGQRYGGLVYAVGAWMSLAVGLAPARLLLALAVLLRPLLVLGVYRIGWELAPPGRRAAGGLLAAGVALALPGLTNYGRVLVLDLPLTVAVAWSAACALGALRVRAAGGEPNRWLAGLGVAVLLGCLIKLNTLAFVAGPLWVVARPSLRARWADRRGWVLGGAALAIGGGLTALLLGSRSEAIRRTLVEATWPGALLFGYLPEGALVRFVPDWLAAVAAQSWEATYYTWLQTLSPPFCVVGLAAMVWFFARRRGCEDPLARAQRDLAFWWLVLPVCAVILLLRGLYDERYVLPLLPLVAAVIGASVMEMPRPRARWSLAAVLLLGGALNHGFVHHDVWPTARPIACMDVPGWGSSERVGALWACAAYPDYRFMDRPAAPSRLDLPISEIEALLAPLRARTDRPLRAVFLDDLYEVFYRLFQSSLLGERPLLQHEDVLLVTDCWDTERMTAVFETPKEVERQILASDVVLMRYGTPTTGGGIRGRRCTVFWSQTVWFDSVGEVPLGDGTTVRVWSKVER